MHINANKMCQFLFQIVGCDRFSNNESNNRVFGPYKQRKVLKTKRKTIMDKQYSTYGLQKVRWRHMQCNLINYLYNKEN